VPTAPFESKSKRRLEIPVPGQRPLAVDRWDGVRPGPRVYIGAGLHGNEINGPALLHKTKEALAEVEFTGTLFFAPVLNISGYRQNLRLFQPFNIDLNRVFPGSPTGTPAQVRAHVIFTEVLQYCEAGLDLHDAGDRNILLPHIRVHRGPEGEAPDAASLKLGRLAGTNIIFEQPGTPGMLAVEATKLFKRTFLTLEVGGGGVLWPEFLSEGVAAVLNILRALKVLDGIIKVPRYQFLLEERVHYRAPFAGLIQFTAPLGQAVHTGDLLATAIDPIDGRTAQVVSQECGVLFDVRLAGRAENRQHVASVLQFGVCPSHPSTKPNIDSEHILVNDPAPGVAIKTEGTFAHHLPLIIQKHSA